MPVSAVVTKVTGYKVHQKWDQTEKGTGRVFSLFALFFGRKQGQRKEDSEELGKNKLRKAERKEIKGVHV